ncbi:sugar transferase [Staphylococcus simiae]|uniref:sugar transferase n=1 Tax=Staphylococcus simiae TaxID=308354 RepID=UPI001A9A0E6F|nr:sugar transferase [Staphylococcus simiae]MBO1198299.1 sugar transferase [Staphylococcus simiae]MBO1201966.1 sugar transferase [Staphylococcus simiae]MBO1204202.1 sugar transferase [Staphylococcus simiae]MBO1210291.1 sugar transferase [Staphylococcus simiae]MBO1230436.1 sugar transferase [Staphylococcus simiae]
MRDILNENLKVDNEVIKPNFNQAEYTYQKKLAIQNEIKKPFYPAKRLFDIIMSVFLLYFTFPIIVFFSILIVLDSFGNPLYKQVRVGKMGKNITIYKLRSMYNNAEANGMKWASKDDPRITKIGKFIRKTRIDELPQLINVLKGEMSFIGPRPERPDFVELFSTEIPRFEQRCLVTPGLTGLAQVQGGYDLSPKEKLEYDLKYINKGNIKMELMILIKTTMVIFTGSGSR